MAHFFSSPTFLLVICAVAFMMSSLSSVDASWDSQHHLGMPTGSLVGEEEEFELDSEINRRILATSHYVSYGALNRDTVPCSIQGTSYYNCRSGGQAHPYNRGCSSISRCRNPP